MEKELLTNVHSALKLPRRISSECIHRLFHYTNYKSKAEIVGDKNIVFKPSRVDKFLDKNEGIQILEPYYHACGDLYESGVIDKNFFLILKENIDWKSSHVPKFLNFPVASKLSLGTIAKRLSNP